ncbi:MAG: recombinase family protein [Oscillospiraceae bacterium]|nr:recombinase family protein [Oscillospiraceae bacterium]
MIKAVTYYRYSSRGQKETSIEGQRVVVEKFAKDNGFEVIREYADRAKTGTTDRRAMFQKMLSDSAKQKFEVVLIYSTDRFARNRYDSAIHKSHLKKHNVRVVSATEPISDDPAGIMVEGVLEAMAEYYSAELSAKVKRGQALAIADCKHVGGVVPIGYKLDDNKKYIIDPLTAPVVQKIYELYSAGFTIRKIDTAITEQFGKKFFGNISNSINRILDNRNYIGVYTRGAEVKDGMPRIIEDGLFEKVQQIRSKKKKSPASTRDNAEYLLTTKLFCGYHGRELDKRVMLVGVSGTSKSGKKHCYYTCKHIWNKKGCNKKSVQKEWIENFILEKAREQLTDDNINYVTKILLEISKLENHTPIISDLKKKLKENEKAIENLVTAIENGEHIDLLSERITQKKLEKSTLENALAREQWEKTEITESEVKFFFERLKNGDENDIKYKRALISIFINAVYLYDDHAVIFFNGIDKTLQFDYNILSVCGESGGNGGGGCSYCEPSPPAVSHRRQYHSSTTGSKDVDVGGSYLEHQTLVESLDTQYSHTTISSLRVECRGSHLFFRLTDLL